ncbi:MAG: hypothetical protein JEZ03_06425 [Bacteroidales bacterium]|nr:hypothetical protein [Bacteroidales bacterium]
MNYRHITGLLFLILIASNAFSQTASEMLSRFELYQSNQDVVLKWTLHEGSTCNGTRIERSIDSTHFEEIGYIAGVCGNPEFEVPYTFTDSSASPNVINYYRIELGFNGYSNTISLLFNDFSERPYIILGNPVISNSILRFNNPKHELIEIEFINTQGLPIYKDSTKNNEFNISKSDFPSGIFIFAAHQGRKRVFSGKIIVL